MRRRKKHSEADALAAIIAGRRPLAEIIARCQSCPADATQTAIGHILRNEIWPGFELMIERGRIDVPRARRLLALVASMAKELEAA